MQTNPKIIICDCDHKDVDTERAVFEAAGCDFKWLHCKTADEVIEQCQGAVCFLNQYAPMNEKVFRAIPTLKFVVRYGVGVDNVNLEDATRCGVQICNVPDYGTAEVADQALALMMALVRKTDAISAKTRQGSWDYTQAIPIHRLSTQTVGIIGLGRIGTAFAERVRALGCRVVAYDTAHRRSSRHIPDFVELLESADAVLEQADIVSMHCSLNDETRAMMNAAAFAKMKKGAYFINVARGGVVDEAALEAAVASGHLGGAGIDVVVQEPLRKDSPLLTHPNVIVTPHMAWYSEEAALELKRKCAEEAVRFLKGEANHYPVNNL